jgi:hypothetical protein
MSNNTRAWEAPVATALSIRSTASLSGGGPDNFLRGDNYGRPQSPAAPAVQITPAVPRAETPSQDQQGWEAPVVTTLSAIGK